MTIAAIAIGAALLICMCTVTVLRKRRSSRG